MMVMSEMQHTRCMSEMHTDDAIYTYGMTGCKIKTTIVMQICAMHELRCMVKCDVIPYANSMQGCTCFDDMNA